MPVAPDGAAADSVGLVLERGNSRRVIAPQIVAEAVEPWEQGAFREADRI